MTFCKIRSTKGHFSLLTVFWFVACFSLCFSQVSGSWRYDLKPGDHLVYRYQFARRVWGGEAESQSKATYTSHVLVLGENGGHLSLGFQRNRQSAELEAYREKGKDKLVQQKPEFDERMAKRDPHFHEANEFDHTGANLDYWQAARETSSKILLGVHEVVELPGHPVAAGDKWKGHDLLGFEYRYAGTENLSGKACARVDGKNAIGRISYWWCAESGVPEKVEFDGEYPLFGDARARETLTFDLVEKRRGEKISGWLQSPDTQRGALDALLLSPWVPFPPELGASLESQERDTQALTLALVYQRHAHLSRQIQEKLAASPDPEVARLAGRLLEASPPVKAFPAERLGTTFRVSRRGRVPYILHVPKDYRGDQLFPLLIYLSGGAGFAIDAANTAEDVIAPSGYLALYPQAGGMWWEDEHRARVSPGSSTRFLTPSTSTGGAFLLPDSATAGPELSTMRPSGPNGSLAW